LSHNANTREIRVWDDLKERVRALESYASLRKSLAGGPADVSVAGLHGGASSLVVACLAEEIESPILVIASDPVSARDAIEDLSIFGAAGVVSYPEDEMLPYDYHDPDRNLTGMQMLALEKLAAANGRILVCTVRSSLKRVFHPATYRGLLQYLEVGGEQDPLELVERLIQLGYERHETVEAKGQFALRGGILDLFEVSERNPVRLEFDGDEISSMRDFDIETQRSMTERRRLGVRPLHHLAPSPDGLERLRVRLEREVAGAAGDERRRMLLPIERFDAGISFFGMEHYAADLHRVVPVYDYFETEPLVIYLDAEESEAELSAFSEEIRRRFEQTQEEGNLYPEPQRVYVTAEELGKKLRGTRVVRFRGLSWTGAVRFSASAPGDYRRNLKGLLGDLRKTIERGDRVFLFCASAFQRERAEDLLADVALEIDFPIGDLSRGFRWGEIGALFLSEAEIFGRYHRPFRVPKASSRSLTYDHSHFKPGDFVVHLNHGIGRYMGLRVLEIEGGKTECIDIRYDGGDHLFIPVSQLRMVEKHMAAEGAEPELSKLGSTAWTRVRERARKSAERIAKDLLEIYAKRQIARGFAFSPDRPWQKEMEASFPYEETPHQLQATAEVKADMEQECVMDRLLSGDVGFGKTEVAVRAAFKAVLSGKQVAVLVPTTVLAMQHYGTLTERLQGYPVNICMLSRFITPSKQKKVVREAAEGKIDVIVGTHRLLSKDVRFKDLGLVVIDEEHRFGVRHKENFKKMKQSVDVLSMTATPIPRTLSMAISGIRDISVIDTPPRNRLPIHTEILPFDDEHIRDAVMREVDRGGQVFFVHNRIQSIEIMEGFLRRLLPNRVEVRHAHGQMAERELERRMIDFLERKFDVLLSTMIIEAGLDFPNVNTIIIDRADKLGLAQLYQLRGRVGRSDRKAYAFLLVPESGALKPTAVQRLHAISEFDFLGAGYRIAMRDLEIRGAGNLLGPQQSGHINAVGLDLYTRMIRDEIARLRGEEEVERAEAKISIPLPAFLPERYVHDTEERMDIYRRLSRQIDSPGVDAIRSELRDRFGPLPEQAENMLTLVDFKVRAGNRGIGRAELKEQGILLIDFAHGRLPSKQAMGELAAEFEGRITFDTSQGLALRIARGSERPREKVSPSRARAAAGDLEKVLKLLEFYAT
jgi:transcription-repair coupling factor (superfamily II helicase)